MSEQNTVSITGPDGEVLVPPMPVDEFHKRVAERLRDDFALEPSSPDGNIPQRVIDELRQAYAIAKDHAQSYSDAAKASAEKYKLKPGALKKYIAAVENDSLDDLDAETSDLERLMTGRTD